MELREYQKDSIKLLWEWLSKNNGNVCVVLPTGSGKSHIIAALVKDAVQTYEGTRILMLTHSKELISQNAEKMRQHWRNAPMGIYSASLNRRCLSEPITFAGIQSVRNKGIQIGHIDLCIVDECHSISHTQTGGYRTLISDLLKINPNMRVVGYSASPYRLGHGMITEGDDVIFDDLIEPVSIEQLVSDGFLAPLRSKHTDMTLSTDGVKKSGGEFVSGALELAVDTNDNNQAVVMETIKRASDRKAWLIFCAGVNHAHHIADLLNQQGITAACVTGDTPNVERDKIIRDFQSGKIRALTNVNVLTTGFDYPEIDCLVMLRPTMSPGLYYQMAGRGLRIAPNKTDCLVLDFAGNVSRHGAITCIIPPNKKGKGTGESQTKTCPTCSEIIALQVSICPSCGHQFLSDKENDPLQLHNDDIMGIEPVEMNVKMWAWRKHTSRASGKDMLKVTYYGNLSDAPVTEYFPVLHDGYAGNKARQAIAEIAIKANIDHNSLIDIENSAKNLQDGTPPSVIKYKREGKFHKIFAKSW